MECPKCNEKVKASSKFCEECGAKIKESHQGKSKKKSVLKLVIITIIVLAIIGGIIWGGVVAYWDWQSDKAYAALQIQIAQQSARDAQEQARVAQQQAIQAQQQSQESSYRQDCIRNCDITSQSWWNGCKYSSSNYASKTCTCSCTGFGGGVSSVNI